MNWLSRLIPRAYRDEIMADLRERHGDTPALLPAIVRSARDARRLMRTPSDPGSRWRSFWADLRGATRSLRARPATAAAVIAILGAALGLNAAVAAVVDHVLLRPLPFAQPEQVAFLWSSREGAGRDTLTPARALDFRRHVSAFESAALIGHIQMTVTGRGGAERWFGASVSSSFFDTLRSPALLGRTFHTDESDRDVIVLSHRLWVEQFGADARAVGTRVTLNGRPRTIVGVMPASFYWPSVTLQVSAENPPLFWTCAPAHDVPERQLVYDEDITRNRTMGFLRMVVRLREGLTLPQAQQEADQVARALAAEHPATDGGRGALLVGAHQQFFEAVGTPLWFIFLGSALVVCAAAINAGGLLLVRQAGRRREFAVRAALGAGTGRLARLVALEGVVLAGAATLLGAVLAAGGVRLLIALTPGRVGRLDAVVFDGWALAWTGVAGLLTALALALLSLLTIRRDRPVADLRGAGSAQPANRRVSRLLVVAEVALAVTLMAGAAMFGQSLWRLQGVDVGLDPARLLTFDVMLSGERAEYQAQQLAFYDGLLDRVRALPGVTAASGAITLPIGGDDFGAAAVVEGRPLPAAGAERRIGFQIVWDNWFETLGMHVLDGRGFSAADRRDAAGVVVINRALADLEWPNENPVGRRLKYSRQDDTPWLTIVGVVSNVHHLGPGEPARPEIYLPYRQMTQARMAVVVRTSGDPMALVPAVRQLAAEVDPLQPTSGFSTMAAHLDRAYGDARFLFRITALFAAASGLLTLVGIYSVTSHVVAQQIREFGVRAALGAAPGRLATEVLRSSLAPVWIGLPVGVALAFWAAQIAQSLLFGTTSLEPAAYVIAGGAIVIAAGAAALGPARRAARIDPVTALRD